MRHIGTDAFGTERLVCRRFQSYDADDMYRNWAADPLVQGEYGEPVYSDIKAVSALLDSYIAGYRKPDYYRWAIIEKNSGENIGQIAFCRVYSEIRTAELEYCIGRAFWGNGYAGEALAGLISHAFAETDFDKLEAYHRKDNVRSGKVLAKSAMHITDNVERFAADGSVPVDEICYCISKNEYKPE